MTGVWQYNYGDVIRNKFHLRARARLPNDFSPPIDNTGIISFRLRKLREIFRQLRP